MKELSEEIHKLKVCIQNSDILGDSTEITQFNTEISKLKHRLAILQRVSKFL